MRDVLGGFGQYAESLIHGVSQWHYWYGLQPSKDPLKGRAPVGEEPIVFDTVAARQMLIDAGWKYTLTGATADPIC